MENNKNQKSQNGVKKAPNTVKRNIPDSHNNGIKKTHAPNNQRKSIPSREPKRVAQNNAAQPKKTERNKDAEKANIQKQKELRRQIIREEQQKKRELAKYKFKRAITFLTLVAMTFLIFAIIFTTVFFINLYVHKSPDTNNYALVLSDYDTELQIKDGYVTGDDGERYINFSQMAEFYEFAMVGSIDNMKYIIKGDESETISFAVGSDEAIINTVKVKMPGKAFYRNGDLYVNEQFIMNYINGFNVESNKKEKKYSISRILLNVLDSEGEIADGKPASYENISFKLKEPVVSVGIAEDDTAVVMPSFDFNTDLDAYEEYMNPGSTTEFLTLVNDTHKLSEDYIPTGLSLLNLGSGMYLKEYAAMSFKAMLKEATACGVTGITVSKAYVSYDELEKEYNDTIDKYTPILGAQQAKRYAAATIATPGKDEHQTGLTFDFATTNGTDFTDTMAYVWFCENSYKFGFIQRYPAGKTDVTGVSSSMSQFRYVGRYHAVRMNALELSLDEYVEYLGL